VISYVAIGLVLQYFFQQAKTLTFSSFSANTPGADCRYILEETAAYKQAVRETDSHVQPLTYWFANKERFPHLFDLAMRYLSVPTTSVDAERSVSQYTAVNAPQRQNFIDKNLALQVMAAFNARDKTGSSVHSLALLSLRF